jgi:bacterial/archaeal transporter family protein
MWLIFAILDALMAAVSVILTKAGIKNVPPILAFALQSVLILIVSWSPVFFKGSQNEIGR